MELEFTIPEKHPSREEKLLVWPSGSFPALPGFSGAGALTVSRYWAASRFCPSRFYSKCHCLSSQFLFLVILLLVTVSKICLGTEMSIFSLKKIFLREIQKVSISNTPQSF